MKNKADNKEIYEAIFDVVRCVPKGRVTSYVAIAKAIGLKSGARMVGRAMSLCEGEKPKVPAHRVVNSSGLLSGEHDSRRKMLEKEGVHIKSGKIADFKTIFWDPLIEITL
jgi:methylated-DNA-protein-cysteine methyltransferase-like protein